MLIFLVERLLNICFANFIGEYDDQGLNLGAFPKQVSDATIFSVILCYFLVTNPFPVVLFVLC